jgi:arylsulfatase A-like enzyme
MTGMFASNYPRGFTPGGTREEWQVDMLHYGLPPEMETLASRLSAEGYATGAVVANRLLLGVGLLNGFSQVAAYGDHLHASERWGLLSLAPFMQDVLNAWYPTWAEERPIDTTRLLTMSAKRFVRQHGGGPFFLYVHFMDPHDPYAPPGEYVDVESPWPFFAPALPHLPTAVTGEAFALELSAEEEDSLQRLYEGSMTYVDDCLGEILGTVAAVGAEGRTNVCVTSDHGEEF